jgi:DNA-binding NarL/FixJ family response regulator
MTVITKKVNVYTGLRTNVLDDDTHMNELLKEIFELNGMPNVRFYTNSDVFVEELNENIHLCIIDQIIPGSKLQGVDVMRVIKGRFPKCQIVFMTGVDDPKVLKEALRLRPDGYVDKNESQYISVLVDVVETCLVNIRKNLELAATLEQFKTYGR